MAKLSRFGVSLDTALLGALDALAEERGYHSRSQAIADFVRRAMLKKNWGAGSLCVGVIGLVFLPDEKNALGAITGVLQKAGRTALSCQMSDLGDGRIFMTVAVSGKAELLQHLADELRGLKGVSHGSFSLTAPGNCSK